jgi:hypothetical protein
VARVDFRLGANGQPYLLEINTLPGLNPSLSDLCIMAAAEGMDYQVLITEILYLAAERNGMPFYNCEGRQFSHNRTTDNLIATNLRTARHQVENLSLQKTA